MPTAAFTFRSCLTVTVLAAAMGRAPGEERVESTAERTAPRIECFSTEQTRKKIDAHKLVDPFTCMRAAAREHNGEALGARLCRLEEMFVYEIRLLRPDGRIVRLVFDAVTGKPHSGPRDR